MTVEKNICLCKQKAKVCWGVRAVSCSAIQNAPKLLFLHEDSDVSMTDILPALNCLRTANAQILLNHQQTPQILSTLGTPLKLPHRTETGSPFADPLMEQLQENIANGVVNENLSNNISRCERVLCIVGRRFSDIEQYTQQSAKEAVGDAPQGSEDLRIIDAQICNHPEERACLLVRFRKMLAVRSLGSEFMQFQENRLHYSRVDVQVNKLLGTAEQTQDGAIEGFIETKRHISDRRTAASMIKNGTKLLVLERLYGHCGLSAILWAAPSWTKLNYSDLPIFVEILSQAPKYAKIRMTVEKLDDWYEQCQAVYDRKALPRQTKGRKRGIEKVKTSQKSRNRKHAFLRQNNVDLLLQEANLSGKYISVTIRTRSRKGKKSKQERAERKLAAKDKMVAPRSIFLVDC
jgi:hypothetical protein